MRAILRWLPFAVPQLYLVVIWWLQPPDRLGDPPAAPWLGRYLYDDYEVACMALRGLNAQLGRSAGQLEHPPEFTSEQYTRTLLEPGKLRPSYYLEYPHAALLIFRLGYALQPGADVAAAPPALIDGWHKNLTEHEPHNDRERDVWRMLRNAVRIYEGLMALALVGLMGLTTVGYEPGGRLGGPAVLWVLPAVLYMAVTRFDIVPALFIGLSLACLGRRAGGVNPPMLAASAVFLAVATLVKVYPLFLAPLCFRYLTPRPREAAGWAAAFGATLAGALALTVLLCGWEETLAPYRVQLSRPPELPMPFLPPMGANGHLLLSFARNGLLLLILLGLCRRPAADMAGLLRRGVIAVLAFILLQVFYSPQWIVWLTPLLVPLTRLHRPVLWLTVALDLVTYLGFPVVFDLPDTPLARVLGAATGLARVAVFALIIWFVARAEFRKATPRLQPLAAGTTTAAGTG